MSRRILILSASAGAGHMRAADALLKAFETRPEVGRVEHWDMLKYTNRAFEHLYGKMYINLVNKAPAVLGWFYELSDTPYRNDKARVMFEKLNSAPFIRALKQYSPDIVVCTHFTPAAVLGWMYENGKTAILPAIVVTDFDAHAMWLVRNYLRYFVAREETRVYLERIGIDSERIAVSGIPVDPVFSVQKSKAAARTCLNLRLSPFTILVSAGGYGVGPVEFLIKEILAVRSDVQVVVIAGRSEELKATLDSLNHPKLVPVGFTSRMDEYMAAADLLVGKPGGLTSSEALARGLPLCIVNPIPGQEERNSDYLLEAGAAIKCGNIPAISWKLEQLIGNPEHLERLRAGAKSLGKPLAAFDIVENLLKQE